MKTLFGPGNPYNILSKWMQFIIFIHQGLFNGGGSKWHWNKLKKINCIYGKHEYPGKYNYTRSGQAIEIVEYVRKRCKRCGFTNLTSSSS